jgi:hypothetical protein
MDMKHWPTVFPRSKNTNAYHLMGIIHREKHGVRWPFVRMTWPYHYLSLSNSTNEHDVAHGHTVFAGEMFNTLGNHITILKSYHKDATNVSFTGFHALTPRFLSEA